MNKGKSRIFSRFGKNSFSDEKKDIRKLELFEEKELMIQIMIQELESRIKLINSLIKNLEWVKESKKR